MDPLACFYAFLGAVQDGELDLAADAAIEFNDWRDFGGYAPTLDDGTTILRLDDEQDRFLIEGMDGVQRWRSCFSCDREAL